MGALHPLSALVFFSWVLAVQLTGLAAFTKGFFLTRVELGRRSQCDIQSLLSADELQHLSDVALQQQQQPPPLPLDGCWLPPRFKRVLWVVVDALRYDFATFSPPEDAGGESGNKPHSAGAKHYLNHLPVISEAIGGPSSNNKKNGDGASSAAFEGSGGVLFQFEADPPTVTMQRLKGLTTGGLPTFIDFRDNFHSPEIGEDNWVGQVRERAARLGRRRAGAEAETGGGGGGGELVFMGDDTWTSLYPTEFSRSYPFPSFNTRDLHTVDDGVLSHLKSELDKRDWDVMVAHFLGVDHVGHTFGPASQAMEDKLDQINTALSTVFETVDDDTAVFVLGDHGMTEDGNHGGATPEETGAALLVWSRSGERLLGPGFQQTGDRRRPAAGGDGDRGGARGPADGKERTSRGAGERAAAGAGGKEGDALGDGGGSGGGSSGGGGDRPAVVGRKVAQIDLVPTISLLLGTPIPFGSLGGVIPEVFAGPYYGGGGDGDGDGGGDDEDDPRHLERLCDALLVNSVQVWRYLSEYAEVASMPAGDMFDLNELLQAARNAHREWVRQQRNRRRNAASGDTSAAAAAEGARELRRVCGMYRQFLDASIGLGRSLWTQYDTPLMGWGLAVLLAATAALVLRVVAAVASPVVVASSSGGAAATTALAGSAASVGVAFCTDAVFGASGGHVFAAKVALCSSLGVCFHYAQAIALPSGGGRGGGGGGRPSMAGSFSSEEGKPAAAGGTTAGAGAGTAFTAVLSALYCAGLFSNSFIEAEDDLHRFLGASSLLSLSALLLLSRRRRAPAGNGVAAGRGGTNTTGGGGGDGGSGRIDDRLCRFFGLSPASAAALYAALAAAFLRVAAGVQDAAAEAGGVSAEAAFGLLRSLAPLPVLWCLCRMSRGGGGGRGAIVGAGAGATARREAGGGGVAVAVTGGGDLGRVVRGGRGGVGATSSGGCCSAGGVLFHGALQAVSLAAVGAYWLNETAAAVPGEKSGSTAAGTDMLPPMRLLLPRAVYLLCLTGLVAAVLRPPAARVRRRARAQQQQQPRHSSENISTPPPRRGKDKAPRRGEDEFRGTALSLDVGAGEGEGYGAMPSSSYSRALADTAGTIVSHLVPVVVLLLGPGSPAVVAFVAAACGCVLRAVSLASAAAAATAAAGTASEVEAVPLGAVAVAWSVVGRAFFFLTGHHNQFSRLQYSAAFVGFDEFDFKVGGLLLFLNTFGTEILAALALPLAAAAAAAPAPAFGLYDPVSLREGASGSGSGSGSGGAATLTPIPTGGQEEYPHPARWSPSPWNNAAGGGDGGPDETDIGGGAGGVLSAMERLSAATLLLSSCRTFLSAANVSVQRGHLMLWAVFAPKFVFDATMQAVCGAAAVLAWAVVLVAHRACLPRGGRGRGRGSGPLAARKKAR